MIIRLETPADHIAIAEVNTAAFGQPDEASLVEQLRADGAVRLSLVAEMEGAVVGHLLFSDLPITWKEGTIDGVALAPISVLSDYQNKGIGRALIDEGLDICRTLGVEAVVVLGHPDYYPRFGFGAALAGRLTSPFAEAGVAFMALELKVGALENGGTVHYAEAFGV